MEDIFKTYLSEIAKVKDELEHSGRTALENLLNEVKAKDTEVIHEPKRDKDGLGAPDFVIKHTKKTTIVGYIENKKVDENLEKILKSEQIKKYKQLTDNLILTDYLEWIWIYKGEVIKRERLCFASDLDNKKFKIDEEKTTKVKDLIRGFFEQQPSTITRVKDLAEKLARPTIEVKKYLFEEITQQKEAINGIFGGGRAIRTI